MELPTNVRRLIVLFTGVIFGAAGAAFRHYFL